MARTLRPRCVAKLAEELGLVDVDFTGPIWERTVMFDDHPQFAGQTDVIFLVRSACFEPTPAMTWDDLRAEGVTAIRWWSRQELAECEEVLAPSRLSELITDLVIDGAPTSTIDVGE